MTLRNVFIGSSFAVAATIAIASAQQPPPQTPATPPPQQPSTVEIRISAEPGMLPLYAVPDFLALTNDRETQEAARTIAEVLWQDLQYEREFDMIRRDIYKSIPQPASIGDPPFDRWREVGADGLIMGSVQKTDNGVRVEMRLYSVRARQQVYAREYTGAIANPRLFAHTIADEVHQSQAQLRGVARTKLTFTSDRNKERVTGTVENRDVKEVYVADYDGANQRRITVGRQLNATPVWAPDGRAIAYTSWRSGFMDIYISRIFEGTMSTPAKGTPNSQNFLPVFSPDGTRLAFASNRDGNAEIYIMNRDGSNVRRITNHPAIDSTPTWSPTGAQIAFTSERGGSPGIYVVGIDGLGLRRISSDSYADRATWSPAPLNEIAYAARTGPGYDVKVLNIASGQTRQITFGEGSNESPAWAPNGRHLAFTSTRAGRTQVFTVDLDGKNVRQITRDGNNFYPNWSQ
jgi:TolB protein